MSKFVENLILTISIVFCRCVSELAHQPVKPVKNGNIHYQPIVLVQGGNVCLDLPFFILLAPIFQVLHLRIAVVFYLRQFIEGVKVKVFGKKWKV